MFRRLGWLLLWGPVGCEGGASDKSDTDTDTDTDTDADADADADTDADTDADSAPTGDTGTVATPCDEPFTRTACYDEYREVWTPAYASPERCGYGGYDDSVDPPRLVWVETHSRNLGFRQSYSVAYAYDASGNLVHGETDEVGFDGVIEDEFTSVYGVFGPVSALSTYSTDGDPGADQVWGTPDDDVADGAADYLETYTRDVDGTLLSVTIDGDGDGTPDSVTTYTNDRVGRPLTEDVDADGDGYTDVFFTNTYDFSSLTTGAPALREGDYDGDGLADSVEETTVDGSVIRTTLDATDIDADGIPDIDGVIDELTEVEFTAEGYSYRYDYSPGDGVWDVEFDYLFDSFTGLPVEISGHDDDPNGPQFGEIHQTLTFDALQRPTGSTYELLDLGLTQEITYSYHGTCASPAAYDLTVESAVLYGVADGTMVYGQLTRDSDGAFVGFPVSSSVSGEAVSLLFPGALLVGETYTVGVWIDLNGDGTCATIELTGASFLVPASTTGQDETVPFDETMLDPGGCDLL